MTYDHFHSGASRDTPNRLDRYARATPGLVAPPWIVPRASIHAASVMTPQGSPARDGWLSAIRRYVMVAALGHFLWEVIQIPLYTIWRMGTPIEIATAILHCTLGDILIAMVTLVAALVSVGARGWPWDRFGRVLGITTLLGVGYTIYSEYLNTVIRQSWSYAAAMPVLPLLGTGIAPLAQWLVVPWLALRWSRDNSILNQTG